MQLEQINNFPEKDRDNLHNQMLSIVSLFNSKEYSSESIQKLKGIIAGIENNEVKKMLFLDKIYSDNFIAKIIAIEVLTPYLINDNEVRSILINILNDNNVENARKAAISVLAPYINKHKEIESAFVNVLNDEWVSVAVQVHLIKAVSPMLYKSELRKLVVPKLNNRNSSVQVVAIEALVHYVSDLEIFDILKDKLIDYDESVRLAAIKAMSINIDKIEIKEMLISALKDQNERQIIREAIIDAFSGTLNESDDIQILFLDIFFKDGNCSIRNAIKKVLLEKLPIEILQARFCTKLIGEKSSALYKSNIETKLEKLAIE